MADSSDLRCNAVAMDYRRQEKTNRIDGQLAAQGLMMSSKGLIPITWTVVLRSVSLVLQHPFD
jgi:hypothetical protein